MHANAREKHTKANKAHTHPLCTLEARLGVEVSTAGNKVSSCAVLWMKEEHQEACTVRLCVFLNLWEQHLCVFKANLCELESFTEARAEKIYLRVALQLHVVVLVIVHACGEWLYLVFTSMSLPAVTEQKLDSSSSPPPVLQYEGDMKVDNWTANQ